MSRIYEALKKAGFETTAISAPAEMRVPETQPSASQEDHVVNLADIGLPRAPEIPPGTSLRFADIKENCTRSDWRPDLLTDIFANPSRNPEAAEQFRTLRSRLYHLRNDSPLRVILITSPISGDGKTVTTANLARAIVRQPDQRVLLIDADLRSPGLHIPLGAPLEPGLCEYLGATADEMAVIQRGQFDGLYFVAAGKAANNASELLSNGRLKRLIQRAAACFDWIIVDSPPCVPVADASVIAGLCDGVLLVVRAGSTPLSAARKACQELQNRKLIGVVLNAVDEKTMTYTSYHERGVYGETASDDSILRLQAVPEKKDA